MRHRGRIWWDEPRRMWRYACYDCDYGAGTVWTGGQPYYLTVAERHTADKASRPAPEAEKSIASWWDRLQRCLYGA